jgi:acid phosphatase type 7
MGMLKTLRGARRSRRAKATVTIAVLASCGLTGGVLAAEGALSSDDNTWPYAQTPASPVLAAVGDISCQPSAPVEGEAQKDVCDKTGTGSTTRFQAQTATANQVEAMKPNLAAILGDEQYEVGRYEDFMGSFDHTYGAFKFLQRPAPGNHEFYDEHGETGVKGYGYFDYYNGYQLNPNGTTPTVAFGSAANEPIPRPDGQAGDFGTTGDGWYSYDLGDWHVISLNAECAVQPGGCNPNGTWFAGETQWLARDLAGDHAACTLAYWHQPTFSAANPSSSAPGADPEGPTADAWWKLLYAHGADVILNGHDHLYARFAPMDPTGAADPNKGIREFIVGTGGESLDTLNPAAANLQAGTGGYYGVMKLTLGHNGYSWDFESAPGAPNNLAGTYSDAGSARCHGPAGQGS